MSKNQKYLLDISKAIASGNCPEDLAKREPGPLSHFRWLTAANRALRLHKYTRSFRQFKNYCWLYFEIIYAFVVRNKEKQVFYRWAKTRLSSNKKTRYLSDELLQVVDPVIQRNAFFAHSENLLLAMLVNDREHIRELGYRRILKARNVLSKKKTVRSFVTLNLNFEAQ